MLRVAAAVAPARCAAARVLGVWPAWKPLSWATAARKIRCAPAALHGPYVAAARRDVAVVHAGGSDARLFTGVAVCAPVEAPTGDPKEWGTEEVQAWFKTRHKGKWNKHAHEFAELTGADMSALSQECFIGALGHITGGAIYNDWQALVGAVGAEDMVAFRDAVRGAEVDDGACVIKLPEGTPWLSLRESPNGHILFVRHFYQPFFDCVLGGMRRGVGEVHGHAIVLGNPGIGKSAFGMYALYRLLRDGRTVVYQSADLGACFVFSNTGARVEVPVTLLNGARHVPELHDPATAFITDAIQPPVVAAKTLLITAPHRNTYWQFGKVAPTAYFPVFSRAEMVACGAACFPLVPAEDIETRFVRWGGIPRYVLQKLDRQSQKELDTAAGGASGLAHALYNLTENRLGHELQYCILHIRIRGEAELDVAPSSLAFYVHTKPSLASHYVVKEIWAQAQGQRQTRLHDFLVASVGNPWLSVVRSQLLERPLTRCLLAGAFRVRRLGSHSDTGASADVVHVELPPSTRVDCHDTADAAAASASGADSMCVFTGGNEAAVDVLLRGGAAAKFTVGETPTIGSSALEDVYSAVDDGWWRVRLGTGDARVFVWVVPADVFASLTDGLPVVKPPALDGVVQFALEVCWQVKPATDATR